MKSSEFPSLSNKEYSIMAMLMEKGEMFGLEMVTESEGALKKGTIYVTLQRMGEKNLVESREEKRDGGENGVARRLYSPTKFGERLYRAQEIALNYLNMGGW